MSFTKLGVPPLPYRNKDREKNLLNNIDLALAANGGREFRDDYCQCDESVGYCPCQYCAIHYALEQVEKYIKERI